MTPPILPNPPTRPDITPFEFGLQCGTRAKLAPFPASMNIAQSTMRMVNTATDYGRRLTASMIIDFKLSLRDGSDDLSMYKPHDNDRIPCTNPHIRVKYFLPRTPNCLYTRSPANPPRALENTFSNPKVEANYIMTVNRGIGEYQRKINAHTYPASV